MYLADKKTILRQKMMDSIDDVVDQYVSDRYLDELIGMWVENGEGVEVVKHIPEFVLKSAFTPAQLFFMENDAAWNVVFPEHQELKLDPYKKIRGRDK